MAKLPDNTLRNLPEDIFENENIIPPDPDQNPLEDEPSQEAENKTPKEDNLATSTETPEPTEDLFSGGTQTPKPQDVDEEEKEWDFVKEYMGFLSNVTDAPDDFQEAAALYLISTFCGRKFTIVSLPETKVFDRRVGGARGKSLNVWFILIGKSRVSRKSTVTKEAEEIIDLVDASLKLSFDFTPQALVKIMAQMSKGDITYATWDNDECSGFFEEIKKGDYMITTDTVLSRIYDGRTYSRETIGRGGEKVPNPYLTMLLASTDRLPGLFDPSRLMQGFLNRFMFIPARKERHIKLRVDDLTSEEEMKSGRLVDWCQNLYTLTQNYTIAISTPAKTLYDNYEEMIERDINTHNLGIKEGYRGNLPNFLLRLAALFRISRMSQEDLSGYTRAIIVVEERDMNRGIAYVEKLWNNFEKVVSLMKTTARSRDVLTNENKHEMVLQIIKDRGAAGISKSDLYEPTGFDKRELEPVLEALEESKRIRWVKPKSIGAGAPKVMYYATTEEDL